MAPEYGPPDGSAQDLAAGGRLKKTPCTDQSTEARPPRRLRTDPGPPERSDRLQGLATRASTQIARADRDPPPDDNRYPGAQHGPWSGR